MNPKANLPAPRIGLNAHLLNLSGNYRSAGINWYIYHLLQNLDPDEFDYTVFLSDPRARDHFRRLCLVQSSLPTHKPLVRIAWEQLVQPLALRRARIELLHSLAFAGPLAVSIPWIVTVYDLSFVRFPESFNTANRIYLNWAVRHSVRNAARVIAISQSTKRDLVSEYGVAPDKVTVVYGGSDPAFAPARDERAVEALRARRHLPDRMILHLGTIEPRKNLVRLVRAFARAKRMGHLPHRLVLAGARGWKDAQVDTAVQEEELGDDVIFAGYVPQQELPLWYQAADVFVYPSLYEGFGLPPLEAMACGTPVVTSNAASLPEVVQDAALVVEPTDVAALADAIVKSCQQPALRDELRSRGLAQAAKFSWARAARETTDVYHAVLDRNRTPVPERGGATDAAG